MQKSRKRVILSGDMFPPWKNLQILPVEAALLYSRGYYSKHKDSWFKGPEQMKEEKLCHLT